MSNEHDVEVEIVFEIHKDEGLSVRERRIALRAVQAGREPLLKTLATAEANLKATHEQLVEQDSDREALLKRIEELEGNVHNAHRSRAVAEQYGDMLERRIADAKALRLQLDTTDPDTKAVWEAAKLAKAEVASWPAWKRGEDVFDGEPDTKRSRECREMAALCGNEQALNNLIADARAEGAREAQQRIEELEESRSMSCENPPENCDCAGCLYADEVHDRARGDK